ncbi:MAG: hypothetical protein B7X06_01745 [Verrucomicrobia bacterium 21-51-4]|nr:MAG: hypothetical protein B7X06_01745 [Verrucomicrobia bacterium 21-51-4]HQU09008.1 hypothetical protein [Opitutales bacterium]
MTKSSPKLEWCIVRLGQDMNWWVKEISDPVHWDVDGLSILDPRQVAHILDLVDPLRDYGYESGYFEAAFFGFKIDKEVDKGIIRLARSTESLLETEDLLFGLPDLLDDEKGTYADFLDHITRCRVKMLNDLIEFEQKLSVEEVEEEIREAQNNAFIEGRATHVFHEVTAILEYIPHGYELDLEEEEAPEAEDEDAEAVVIDEEEFPDLEEEEIEEDETMKWEHEEEKKEEEYDENERPEGLDDDIDFGDEDGDDEDSKPARKSSKKK